MLLFARCLLVLTLFCFPLVLFGARDNVVNVYTWAEELPSSVISQFEKETGIKVNYSTFDSNELMFAKMRSNKNQGFDLIEPSTYYVQRMSHLNMLEQLDKTKLPNFKNLDPAFTNRSYDPKSTYSVPFVWGVTGIFVNKDYFVPKNITKWNDLLDKQYKNQLVLVDDPREAFSMALLMLNYSINDTNPDHIKQAYYKLRSLMPNIRLFNNDAIISILIDEDATMGLVWNGDLYKASLENSKLNFIFPKNHFEIWVDNFAIPNKAPHLENAYKFLNFLMRPDIAKTVSLNINYSTANLAAKNLMPIAIKNNPFLYPSAEILKRGEFENDIGDNTFALMEKYWEQLKIGG